MALTKADIAEQLYEELGLNKREAKEFVETFFGEISDILESGLDVQISSRRVVTFRAGQKLKARVENNAFSD
jgi:integration host factor subunit alpha